MSQNLDLSRRAVAAGFSGRDGTAWVDPEKNWPWRVAGGLIVWDHHAGWPGGPPACDEGPSIARALPDFRDAATRGVLLQQVRERWDDPWLCVAWTGVVWICVDRHGIGLVPPCRADTETAALVAALEAAPERK